MARRVTSPDVDTSKSDPTRIGGLVRHVAATAAPTRLSLHAVDYFCASTEPPMRSQSQGIRAGHKVGGGPVVEVPQGLVHAVDRDSLTATRCGAPLDDLHLVAVDFRTVVNGRCVCCLDKLGDPA